MDLFPLLRPLLAALPPETAHALTLPLIARLPPHRAVPGRADPILAQRIWGLDFANPLGTAAGLDKHAQACDGVFGLGLGFAEAGGVTPEPQPGNPKPRVFRLAADAALINRIGFASVGREVFARRLARRGRHGPLGVNLGKNKTSESAARDYALCARAVAADADFLVINISSPNTAGLRESMQSADAVAEAVAAVRNAVAESELGGRRVPILVKVSPDLTAADEAAIVEAVQATRPDGLVVGNTTRRRPPELRSPHATEEGGLSGAPLFAQSTTLLARLRLQLGPDLPLIGCGGVASGADAYAKIRAGACLVQLYTALTYRGPALVPAILLDLAARLRADGHARICDAIGRDAAAIARGETL
ncbi:quinone-dependent dihydroorotate dehydrogenase [Marinibaculum pumilum]|uniref:Dihydroorotate dehydrogenase (quinone) n=1 Tax=Marinibaculum pumilum TaxID=1766165 RepID=A0ABV7L224_9PROT